MANHMAKHHLGSTAEVRAVRRRGLSQALNNLKLSSAASRQYASGSSPKHFTDTPSPPPDRPSYRQFFLARLTKLSKNLIVGLHKNSR